MPVWPPDAVATDIAALQAATPTTVGAFASPPASPTHVGQLHVANDSIHVQRWNGSSWDVLVPGHVPGIATPPQVGDYNWINQGTSTASNTKGPLRFVAAAASPFQYRILNKAYTGAMNLRAYLTQRGADTGSVYGAFGIQVRNASTGEVMTFTALGRHLLMQRLNSPSSWNSSPLTINDLVGAGGLWLEIDDDGAGTLTFGWSADGETYETLLTESYGGGGDFFGVGDEPDGYGLVGVSVNAPPAPAVAVDAVANYHHVVVT